MIKKTCDFCLRKFTVYPYRESQSHFCSFKCYNDHRAKTAYPKKICPYCKAEFMINRETRYRKYCSQECANLARRKYSHKDKICLYCNKKIKYSSRNPKQKYCSVLCQVKSRAHPVDERFFQTITSEGKAYLLGLIFSDGSISNQKSYLNISSKDEDLIKICKKLLKTRAPIYHYQNSFSLNIGNQNIHKSLRQLGVLPRKSWKEYQYPKVLDLLKSHFLRGVFDGDGSFYIDDRGKWKYLCASFSCNSQKFLKDIRNHLGQHDIVTNDIRFDKKPNNTGSWQLRITRKEAVKKFTNYLYENSNYFLERKNKIAKTFYG